MCKFAVIAVLAFCFSQGSALKCHVCTSATDAKCSDPVDSSLQTQECTPTLLKEAQESLRGAIDGINNILGGNTNVQVPNVNDAFACAKVVKQDGDKKVVIRSCAIKKTESIDFCAQAKTGGATFCETCDSDGCNGASGLASSSLLLALLVALVAYLTKQ